MKKQIIISYYLPLILFVLFEACSQGPELIPLTNWTQLNDFPGTARASATSFVYNDKAFVGLGRSGATDGFLKDLWCYDCSTGEWTRKSDFPGEARVKAIGAVVGDKAYIGLGAIGAYAGNQFSDFWEYDILNDRWKQVASFPGPATNDLFCAAADSCIYTTEGYTDTQFNSNTYKYDPEKNTWTRLSDCPVKRSGTAGFMIGDNLYVGTGFNVKNYRDFYCYHIPTDRWSRIADVPEGRILAKGLSIDDVGYIMLGRYWRGSLNGGKLLPDIMKYDPSINQWSRCGDFPGGGRQNMAVFTLNGKGYIVGGEDDFERKSDVWEFQP